MVSTSAILYISISFNACVVKDITCRTLRNCILVPWISCLQVNPGASPSCSCSFTLYIPNESTCRSVHAVTQNEVCWRYSLIEASNQLLLSYIIDCSVSELLWLYLVGVDCILLFLSLETHSYTIVYWTELLLLLLILCNVWIFPLLIDWLIDWLID